VYEKILLKTDLNLRRLHIENVTNEVQSRDVTIAFKNADYANVDTFSELQQVVTAVVLV
jgi:hypothetical protein